MNNFLERDQTVSNSRLVFQDIACRDLRAILLEQKGKLLSALPVSLKFRLKVIAGLEKQLLEYQQLMNPFSVN